MTETKTITARPLLVLSAAILAMMASGTQYWFPALAPGLQSSLHLTSSQITAIVATANSGSWLGFIGGFFHARHGTRRTAVAGAACICMLFLSLSVLVAHPLATRAANFVALMSITVLLDTSSFALYSSCICAAASVFPPSCRGRVVGIAAAFYGASAGFFATIQAAFFPSLRHTHSLLLFVAAVAACAFHIAIFTFPGKETYAVRPPRSVSGSVEHTGLLLDAPVPVSSEDTSSPDDEAGLRLAFALAWMFVTLLQVSAVSDALNAPRWVHLLCAALVTFALLAFTLLPFRSSTQVYSTVAEDTPVQPLQPYVDVFFDPRYLFLCYGFFAIIGGGSTAILVQAPHLLASRLRASDTLDVEHAAAIVRSFVIVFSACNVTARLLVATVMDRGATTADKTLWKYDLLVGAALVGSIGLLFAGYLNLFFLYVAFAIMGCCQGVFFSASPALATIWFGVQAFPRNFSLLGLFTLIGAVSVASVVPRLLSDAFGTWVELPVKGELDVTSHVCVGLLCSGPTFSMLSAVVLLMFVAGIGVRNVFKSEEHYSER